MNKWIDICPIEIGRSFYSLSTRQPNTLTHQEDNNYNQSHHPNFIFVQHSDYYVSSPAVISCVASVWSAGYSPKPRLTVLFAAVSSWIQKSEAVGYESLHVCFCEVNFLVVAISVGVIFRAFWGGIIWSWYLRHLFPTYRRLWGSQEEVTADVEVSRVLAGCASDDGASPLVSS